MDKTFLMVKLQTIREEKQLLMTEFISTLLNGLIIGLKILDLDNCGYLYFIPFVSFE